MKTMAKYDFFFGGGGGISEQKVFQSCKNQLNRWFLKRSNHKEKKFSSNQFKQITGFNIKNIFK